MIYEWIDTKFEFFSRCFASLSLVSFLYFIIFVYGLLAFYVFVGRDNFHKAFVIGKGAKTFFINIRVAFTMPLIPIYILYLSHGKFNFVIYPCVSIALFSFAYPKNVYITFYPILFFCWQKLMYFIKHKLNKKRTTQSGIFINDYAFVLSRVIGALLMPFVASWVGFFIGCFAMKQLCKAERSLTGYIINTIILDAAEIYYLIGLKRKMRELQVYDYIDYDDGNGKGVE